MALQLCAAVHRLAVPCFLPVQESPWAGPSRRQILFLTAAATFLMSLTPVEFPRNPEYGTGLAPHIRAMWIMLIAVVSYGIPVGMLDARARRLSAQKEADETRQEKEEAVRTRAEEVVRDDDILVKSEYKTIHIPVSAIQYIEGRNNYACFHLDHRDDVVTQKPLKDLTIEQMKWLDNDSKAMKQLKDELPYVPGFYRSSSGRIEFISYTGIGFVVRDDRKKPLGISVRKDKAQEGEKRYGWEP